MEPKLRSSRVLSFCFVFSIFPWGFCAERNKLFLIDVALPLIFDQLKNLIRWKLRRKTLFVMGVWAERMMRSEAVESIDGHAKPMGSSAYRGMAGDPRDMQISSYISLTNLNQWLTIFSIFCSRRFNELAYVISSKCCSKHWSDELNPIIFRRKEGLVNGIYASANW